MSVIIGENQIHEVVLEMPFDLSAQTLEVVYVPKRSGQVHTGGTASGAPKGEEVTIATDLAENDIPPGEYILEVRYTELGTERELTLDGITLVEVNDAKSVS